VLRDIEVQDFSTVVANNKEAVEQVEGEGWYAEEVHGGNGFTVIVQKSQPTPLAGSGFLGARRSQREMVRSDVSASEERSHSGRFGSEPVIH
jgi:hypothetical protein